MTIVLVVIRAMLLLEFLPIRSAFLLRCSEDTVESVSFSFPVSKEAYFILIYTHLKCFVHMDVLQETFTKVFQTPLKNALCAVYRCLRMIARAKC